MSPSVILIVTGVTAIVAAATLHETAGRKTDAVIAARPAQYDPVRVGE